MIFSGIEKYIAQSSQTRGRTFHVTMTYFWIQMVHFGICSMPPLPLDPGRYSSLSKMTTAGTEEEEKEDEEITDTHSLDSFPASTQTDLDSTSDTFNTLSESSGISIQIPIVQLLICAFPPQQPSSHTRKPLGGVLFQGCDYDAAGKGQIGVSR